MTKRIVRMVGMPVIIVVSVLMISRGVAFTAPPLPPVPADFADKHMPEGWWTDPKVLAEGEKVYMGLVHPKVNCSNCHGKDGQPKKKGARDLRSPELMNRFSDSFWFWRVKEGVPKTKMPAWKQYLSDEQIWSAIAFEHSFSHKGQPADHTHAEIQLATTGGK